MGGGEEAPNGAGGGKDELASSEFSVSDGKILRKIVANCSAFNRDARGGKSPGGAVAMNDDHLVSEVLA